MTILTIVKDGDRIQVTWPLCGKRELLQLLKMVERVVEEFPDLESNAENMETNKKNSDYIIIH